MPRFSPMLAAAAISIAFAATGPAGAAMLHPSPAAVPFDRAPATIQVDHRRRHHSHNGGIYFNFGFGSPFYEPYYQPYYSPRVYPYDPYYYRYYQPNYAPQYYTPAPAPYVYTPAPAPYSDSTGRCPSGQYYRYPVGCVPG